MRVTGVDACRGGWVAVSLTDGTVSDVHTGVSLELVISGQQDAVGIDMPLGLLESGWREADRQARLLLGPRRSSVFAIPPRAVWMQADYTAANRRCRELTGKGFSVQAWNLRPKLLEANEFRAASGYPLFEVHPELAFAALAGGPLALSKHVAPGRQLRMELLASAGIVVPETAGVPLADLLDAAAAAWSAHRIAAGQAVTIPDPPGSDDIAIRYLRRKIDVRRKKRSQF